MRVALQLAADNQLRLSRRRLAAIRREAMELAKARGTASRLATARGQPAKASPLRVWCCWMRDEDFDRVARINRRHKLSCNSEGVRLAIRMHALASGFHVPSGEWE